MLQFTHTIQSKLGIHARVAMRFFQLSKKYKRSMIELHFQQESYAITKPVVLMNLAIKKGDIIEFVIDGEDEMKIIKEIEKICNDIL